MKYKHISILILILLFAVLATAGESLFGITNNSLGMLSRPYSGAGFARSYETAASDTLQINYTNYALWTDLKTPTYSAKLSYNAAFGKDGKQNYFNDVANFQGGYLAIPILRNRLVFGAGLQPFTAMEQRLDQTVQDSIHEELLVRGGLSKALINVSFSPSEYWGIGLGYEYNFGKILKQFRLEYAGGDAHPLSFNYEYRYYGHGMVASGFFRLKDKMAVGLSYRPAITLNVRIHPNTHSDEANKSELKKLTIPSQYNFGLSYKLADRWNVGADFMYQNWATGYKIENETVTSFQAKYYNIGFGFERKQSAKRFTSFGEKLEYRMGGFVRQLSHTSNGNPVKEYGVSFGVSLPIQRFRSHVDFYGIVGKRGNLGHNRYQETFVNFGLSISASELWFVNFEN